MILEVNGLSKSFNSKELRKTVVDNISFSISDGECLGLIGESGCGKSTTANLVTGLLKADTGTIIFLGKDITKTSGACLRDARKQMQMVFQSPQSSFNPRLS